MHKEQQLFVHREGIYDMQKITACAVCHWGTSPYTSQRSTVKIAIADLRVSCIDDMCHLSVETCIEQKRLHNVLC